MSHVLVGIAQRKRIGSPTHKAVFMLMASCASDDGSGIWMSKANMAADLEMGRRTVQVAIDAMIEIGILKEAGKKTCKNGFTVEYLIDVAALEALPSTRAGGAHVQERHVPRAGDARQDVQEMHTNLPLTFKEPSNTAPAFDEFWAMWPNKVSKGDALTAWKKLKADEKRRVVEVCASWFAAWRKANPELSPIHPATFLNKRRWEDEGVSQPTAPVADIRQALADRIKSGKAWLVRDISPAQARELIAAGLVTQEDCRKAGVA
jgi:hypothetical protein